MFIVIPAWGVGGDCLLYGVSNANADAAAAATADVAADAAADANAADANAADAAVAFAAEVCYFSVVFKSKLIEALLVRGYLSINATNSSPFFNENILLETSGSAKCSIITFLLLRL